VPTTISGTAAQQWKWVVHEWTSTNCTTGPQTEDADNTREFAVAEVKTYSDATLTTLKTVFLPTDTVFLVFNAFIPSHTDAEVTWIKPDNTNACANTG